MDIGNVLFEMDKLINYFNNNCKSKSLRISKEVKVFVESQQQEIERLKGDRWISVEDRLPEGKCLVWLKEKTLDRNIHSAVFSDDGINYVGSYFEWDMKHNPITHWQPLPTEPKEG